MKKSSEKKLTIDWQLTKKVDNYFFFQNVLDSKGCHLRGNRISAKIKVQGKELEC